MPVIEHLVYICRAKGCKHEGEQGMAFCSDRGHQRAEPFIPLATYERLCGVITVCRESAGLIASPDGPTGDVRNIRNALTLAQREVGRQRPITGGM